MHVDALEPIERSTGSTTFNKLVLPDKHKRIIQSQVEQHFRQRTSSMRRSTKQLDLVQGKGKGLIILLHGEY